MKSESIRLISSVAAALAATVLWFAAPVAAALDPSEIPGCASAQASHGRADGSVLVAGNSGGNCAPYNRVDAPGEATLFQLRSDGTPDPGFAGGGALRLGSGFEDLIMSGEDAIVVTSKSVKKLRPDGSLATGYGAEATDYGAVAYGALGPDGGLKVARTNIGMYGQLDARFRVTSLTADGDLDPAFGEGGVATVGSPPGGTPLIPVGLAVDTSGRTVAVTLMQGQTVILRLRADGQLDPAFGSAGNGYVLAGAFTSWDAQVRFGDSGEILVYADNRLVRLGEDGNLIASEAIPFDGAHGLLQVLPDGDRLFADLGANGSMSDFAVTRFSGDSLRYRAFGEPLSTLPSVARGASLDPGGKITVTGSASAYLCAPGCAADRRMVIGRIDAQTGNPDASFGEQGIVALPVPTCDADQAAIPETGARFRCPMAVPGLTARGRFTRTGLRAVVRVEAGERLRLPLVRRVSMVLPKAMKARARLRPNLTVTTARLDRGTLSLGVHGRKIFITHRPDPDIYGVGRRRATNRPARFEIRVSRRAFRDYAAVSRKSWRIGAGVRYRPLPTGDPAAAPWIAGNGVFHDFKVRRARS